MTSIAIVGAGIAGTHLGLFLRHHGIDTVLYAEHSADEQRQGPLRNVATHFGSTRAREKMLGIDPWTDAIESKAFHFHVLAAPEPFSFHGAFEDPALSIDHRLHLPVLMRELEARGGQIEIRTIGVEDYPELAQKHDLVVVCTGRSGNSNLFPRIPERSPYDEPQRHVTAGIYHGIRTPEPVGLSICLTEHGEIFSAPYYTFEGRLGSIGFEARPGGAIEYLSRLSAEDDPRAFEQEVLKCVRAYAPVLLDLIDEKELRLAHLVQGALTPVVRHNYARLDASTFALALGDAHIVNDPLTAQGANLASYAACLLAETIAEVAQAGMPMDEAFCQRVERDIWEEAGPTTMWTNQMLGPPPEHLFQVMMAAATNRGVGEELARAFEFPARQWDALATPESAARFLERFAS